MASKALPTPEELRQLLDYDPDTGAFTWRERPVEMFSDGAHSAARNAAKWNRRFAGKPAFIDIDYIGYRHGAIWGTRLKGHRVAWAIHYGAWPDKHIDHINHDRADNRIANLRNVTQAENSRNASKPVNNKSGVVGVVWNRRHKRWNARINVAGRNMTLGAFIEKQDAVAARKAAEVKYGYHPNHGT